MSTSPEHQDQVARFVACVFEPDDIVEIRCLPSKHSTWRPASALAEHEPSAHQNVYIGANPRSAIGGTDGESVAIFRCLFADIDGVTLAEALARLAGTPLPLPTVIVSTGGGVHLYWRLIAPLTDAVLWTGMQKVVIAVLGSDKVIHDPPRIMRLPGTHNHKRGVDSRLVEAHPDRRYSLNQFPPLAAEGRVQSTAARVASLATTNAGGVAGLSRATLLFLHQGAAEGERNGKLFAAACDFAGCGLSQEQAQLELGEAARRCSLEDKEVRDAIVSAYSKARTPSKPPAPPAASTKPAIDVIFEHGAGAVRIDCKPGDERGRAVLTVWNKDQPVFTDDIKITSSRSRADFLKKADKAFPGLDGESIDTMLVAKAVELSRLPDPSDELPPPSREDLLALADDQTEQLLSSMPPEVVKEAHERLRDPRLIDQIVSDIAAAGVVGERTLSATIYVQGTSRKLPKPLSAITQGVTSSGKSYVQECVAGMFPSEDVLLATDITTQALYYMPPGSLVHKFVVAGERSRRDGDDRAEATRALREMIASGELRKLVPAKTADGRMVTRTVWQPGPIAFIESTTLANIFDEDANRCILLGTDESQTQTDRILFAQGQRAAGATTGGSGVLVVHHAMQRLLRRCRVSIPFAPALAKCVPTVRQDARRAMPQILAMISAVALIHQYQRTTGEIYHGTEIVATIDDYVVARGLLVGPMGRSLGGGLPDAVARFGTRVATRYGGEIFTSSEAAREDENLHSKGKVNEYLRRLEDAGAAECVEPGKGSLPAKWKMVGPIPEAGEVWLPTVAQLLEVPL